MSDLTSWTVSENAFDPSQQHHKETIFTIGNGYLATRGAFEEGYPEDRRATFVHGVFDATPLGFTELANAPDWLPFTVWLEGERFSLDRGTIHAFQRTLDLRTGVLSRTVRWRSPFGRTATVTYERFASLADPHLLLVRCRVVPEFAGALEFRAALNGGTVNEWPGYWLAHWYWEGQGVWDGACFLLNRTRTSGLAFASAMQLKIIAGGGAERDYWDVENSPTFVVRMEAVPGREVVVEKVVAVYSSRDEEPLKPASAGSTGHRVDGLAGSRVDPTTPPGEAGGVVERAVAAVNGVASWQHSLDENTRAWAVEWDRSDVMIEGDDEAQIALRFNLFQLLIAAPRDDERVSIGAKTLSGFGYRGHAFWDTEIFMLPLFTFTAPHIARNLLNYRYHTLDAARQKAKANGFEGAQFAWESADTGEEVTPTWVPHFADRNRLVRIWTGDIEIHISAGIAYAACQYWRATGDDEWFIEKGAEVVLDTAKFWAARAEWDEEAGRYEYNDVIGPDEYHDHVDNNAFTNRMAQWNLQTALDVLRWLETHAPAKAAELTGKLQLQTQTLDRWRDVIEKIYMPVFPSGLIEQFEGYFGRRDVDLAALEPRTKSIQELFGIEGAGETQAIKQPDVLMLLYLLREHYGDETVRLNYDYYSPRTDHTFGSSLGPSIQAIMACEVGRPEEAYEHFIRAVRADLRNVRGNAADGIHAASAGGTWQAAVFGFGGLRVTPEGWTTRPRLPGHWKRLAFKFFYRGERVEVDLKNMAETT